MQEKPTLDWWTPSRLWDKSKSWMNYHGTPHAGRGIPLFSKCLSSEVHCCRAHIILLSELLFADELVDSESWRYWCHLSGLYVYLMSPVSINVLTKLEVTAIFLTTDMWLPGTVPRILWTVTLNSLKTPLKYTFILFTWKGEWRERRRARDWSPIC